MVNTQEASINMVDFHKFAHEIKNPLAICNGYMEIIEKRKKEPIEEYLKIIHQELRRSLTIINDYSKNQIIQNNTFDLYSLIEDVLQTMKPLFQEQKNKIIAIMQKDCIYQGNYNQLKQVLVNLLKNAQEAKIGEELLIVVQLIAYDDYYQIVITDNGMGMSKEQLNRIKETYYTTKEYGTGLGVSFCREVIQKHRGDLFYRSKKELGTKVIVSLPK